MKLLEKIMRFIIVGSFTTSFNYLVFYMLWALGINYTISAIIGYCSGIAMGYIFHKVWVFGNNKNHSVIIFSKYVISCITILGVNIIILTILVEYLKIHVLISYIIAIGITTCLNFMSLKFLIFQETIAELENNKN